jgi:hypothetical protein
MSSFNLSALNGQNGFIIKGIDNGDNSGYSVSNAGDINRDGIDDLIIGAPDADPNGQFDAGESYVVFGSRLGFGFIFNLSSLNGTDGFAINGMDQFDNSGRSVSSAGDVNGDGIGDLIIGAPNADPNGQFDAGESYVVYGSSLGFGTALSLSSLSGTNGFIINGIDGNDNSGFSVSSAGDVNGDGIDDLLIGTRVAQSGVGKSYVVFGRSRRLRATLNLSTLNGANGFLINGIDGGDDYGFSVSSAGDVNGDGIDDLIIGASDADPNGQASAGKSYVLFGNSRGFSAALNLSFLNGTNGFVINGIDEFDYSGNSVSGAGDVNGDGIDDLIIGARNADSNGQDRSGKSYVVFGSSRGFSSTLNLSTLNGDNGFVINGINEFDFSGSSVSSAGDVNGDGISDLIIGAPFAETNGRSFTGESYVVFGSSRGFSSALNLSTLSGDNGFVINGIGGGDNSGNSVGSAGDVNGDGIDDLIIGADRVSPYSQYDVGESYVIFGSSDLGNAPPELKLDTNGFVINGVDVGESSGRSVSGAGDVNGDGIDDLIIGAGFTAPYNRFFPSKSYVVFGSSRGFRSDLNLFTLNGNNGFVINGIPRDRFSESVSNAGDVNGDGIDDLIIGASDASSNGQELSGKGYVVFGSSRGFHAVFNPSTLNGTNGFVINGADRADRSGVSVSRAGDVNSDGIDDLIIGAPDADPNGQSRAGKSYVMFGSRRGFSSVLNLSALNGSNGFAINGIDKFDNAGVSVSNAGDVNGDSIDDLIIGANSADPNGKSEAGESYVVFGRSRGFSSTFNLSTLNGTNGFVINGINRDDYSGSSVSRAGDVNGDGIDDLIIGSRALADFRTGQSYVVFGSSRGFNSAVNPSSLNGTNGFVINGIDLGDGFGFSVSDAGDVNGDGIDDLIIGAPGADPNGQAIAGESYVVFGSSRGFNSGVLDLDSTRFNTVFSGTPTSIVGKGLSLTDVNSNSLTGAKIRILNPFARGVFERLTVTVTGTNITARYNSLKSTLNLSGTDSLANYKKVLRSIQYDFTGSNLSRQENRQIEFVLDDGKAFNNKSEPDITTLIFGDVSLVGDKNSNQLVGNNRNNTLSGLGGNDLLEGLLGIDRLNGGEGIDTASYQRSDRRVIVNLTTNINLGGHAEGDLLTNIEWLTGSNNDDRLSGDQFNNLLSGLRGNDLLEGADGIDTLNGNEGADTLTGGFGADVLVGGFGADLQSGGEGADRFSLEGLNDSLLRGVDAISDFAIGEDVLDGPTAISAANVVQLGSVANLREATLQTFLSAATFGANRGATFTNGTRKTFLALNDGVAGFSATTDAVINITGYTGNLTGLAIA